MTVPVPLLGISGSLRRGSHNTAVLRSLATLLQGQAELRIFALDEIPPYNAELDGEAPPLPVQALKAAITQARGLVICSPEYNYGMPGVLKNALDWASRPGYQSPLKDKPALIMTASPGAFGGARAQSQIREVLSATLARPIARQHVAIPVVHQKFSEGHLVDEVTAQFLREAAADLLAEVALLARR